MGGPVAHSLEDLFRSGIVSCLDERVIIRSIWILNVGITRRIVEVELKGEYFPRGEGFDLLAEGIDLEG